MPLGTQSVCPLDQYTEECLEMTVTGLVGLYFYLFVVVSLFYHSNYSSWACSGFLFSVESVNYLIH